MLWFFLFVCLFVFSGHHYLGCRASSLQYHTIFASAAYNWLFVTSCFDCNSGGAMGAQVNKEGILLLESIFSPLASVHNWCCQLSPSCVCCPVSGFFFFNVSTVDHHRLHFQKHYEKKSDNSIRGSCFATKRLLQRDRVPGLLITAV